MPSGPLTWRRRILQALVVPPCDLEGHQVDISACGGIALFPTDASDSEQLFRNADLALYEAKAAGPVYKFYTEDMGARAQARHELEHDLRSALLNGEFTLEYQPLVSLKDDGICCCEALLRWHHPQHGWISPAVFIPLAESSGFIVPIGQWVLREACMQAASWPAKISVAVNLSVAQFKSADLVPSVTRALAHSGLAPERLELEVTESILLDDSHGALRKMRQLRNLGAKIALDDFGTGYSSLAYLQTFSFDKIKIDRCFVSGLSQGKPTSRAIMRAVAELGASLGIATTAEGVETPEQLDIVRAEGCTEVQGYLFSPPKSAEEIASLVASEPSLPRRENKPSLLAVVDGERSPVVLASEHEERRLQALQSYGILDTSPEESFDRITRLARLALNAPMAMISLVDRDRQWFKSKQGVEVDETPRSFSFCTYTIRKDSPLVVGDATQDPRFRNSPLVTGAQRARICRRSSVHTRGLQHRRTLRERCETPRDH
ncbi:MAG: EAL domain-containing protein [Rhodospirillales bacterium]|nr:EAL domain-containing protein [Rhodospirillales bacterium]